MLHAYGAVFDNPDLIACCVVGDGEAESGPLATSWHSNKFLNPRTDGAVLPILHLNGYKITNPAILARISHAELESVLVGYGYKPCFVEGDKPEAMHRLMANAVDTVIAEIREIQRKARDGSEVSRPRGTTTTPFDMVVLNTLDRFHLVMDVASRVPELRPQAAHIKQRMRDKLNQHTQYIHQHGEDMPEIRN